MEPEGSLPHSKAPAICPYPEPDQSSPSPHIPLLEDPFQYYSPIYAFVFQVVSFSHVSPPKPSMYLSSAPYVPYALPISLNWSPEHYLLLSSDTSHSLMQNVIYLCWMLLEIRRSVLLKLSVIH